ncbi:inositol monophosphatase [Halobacteriales archaeon SW_7_68_16]|nr:MAG: inositol monophosphatase [Halobacteriales archaeon SW_7_68_16]
MDDTDRRSEVALAAARAGAAVASDRFRSDVAVETKDGKTDVVTQADRDAQRAVVDSIREAYPGDPIVGEEDGQPGTVPESGPAWVVDPIDGTNNYVRGVPLWATAVAAVRDGRPIAAGIVAPELDDAYRADDEAAYLNGRRVTVAERTDLDECTVVPTIWWNFDARDQYAAATGGIVRRFGDLRRIGCAQLALATLAAGGIDGVFTNLRPNPWDSIAGCHVIRVAGGRVTDLNGDDWRHDATGMIATSGPIHDEVLAVARETDAERDDPRVDGYR